MNDINRGRWEQGLVCFLVLAPFAGAYIGSAAAQAMPEKWLTRFLLLYGFGFPLACASVPIVINAVQRRRIYTFGSIIATWVYCALMFLFVAGLAFGSVMKDYEVIGPELAANERPDGIVTNVPNHQP